jgi:hypothetical protein
MIYPDAERSLRREGTFATYIAESMLFCAQINANVYRITLESAPNRVESRPKLLRAKAKS